MIDWNELPRAEHLAQHIVPAHRRSAAALASDMTMETIVRKLRMSRDDLKRHAHYIRHAMGRSRADRMGQDNPLHPENWRWQLAQAAYGTGPCWCEAHSDGGKKK